VNTRAQLNGQVLLTQAINVAECAPYCVTKIILSNAVPQRAPRCRA